MGDVQTGDGIQRIPEKPGEQSLLAPLGGEGGSVLQALGSKAEERAKRRKKKKDSYAKYLESATWKKIRAAALERDKHTCRACKKRAQVVHHIRYPKNLGQEKLEWLYSLCIPCHDEIHRLANTMLLRKATRQVLASHSSVVVLDDDWRLSKNAVRGRQLARGKKKPPRTSKKRLRRGRSRPAHVTANARKVTMISGANEKLHEVQKRARENRERLAQERATKLELETWLKEAL